MPQRNFLFRYYPQCCHHAYHTYTLAYAGIWKKEFSQSQVSTFALSLSLILSI